MASLIETDHTSNMIDLSGGLRYCVLRGRVNDVGYLLDECIMSYLEASGFESVALIRMFDLKYNLISMLVKLWRLETHTFHVRNAPLL
ncbi:hypothetical protein PVK06_030753 [Gossypium arboreum]|uniref:Uncharacterized protein n=1 Tax=Gossypium arboreum TaxID=29729 RepID=A0ABR0NP54_GOSAR|nr:hypothetical protein PVK06_030753 [Gossypium arboreum]